MAYYFHEDSIIEDNQRTQEWVTQGLSEAGMSLMPFLMAEMGFILR